jgi:hypothetical protein
MRALAIGLFVGLIALAFKVWFVFSVWVLPLMTDAVNAVAWLVAVVVLGLLALKKGRLAGAGAVTLALTIAALDIPVAIALAHARVHDAQRYCEDAARGPTAVADRTVPVLLRPGYSVRYAPQITERSCSFPDPFPGRTFWEGAARPDGTWAWQTLMD